MQEHYLWSNPRSFLQSCFFTTVTKRSLPLT